MFWCGLVGRPVSTLQSNTVLPWSMAGGSITRAMALSVSADTGPAIVRNTGSAAQRQTCDPPGEFVHEAKPHLFSWHLPRLGRNGDLHVLQR